MTPTAQAAPHINGSYTIPRQVYGTGMLIFMALIVFLGVQIVNKVCY
jgi:hypothetical protein